MTKSVAHKVVSILIVLASIFGLLAGALGIRDALAVKTYLEGDGSDPVAQLSDGLVQLKDNEKAYNDGLKEYKAGLIQLEDGEAQLADGAAQLAQGEIDLADGKSQLAQGRKDLADGEKQLADGYAQYNAGKKQLAEGQKLIDENTAAYLEGKETLASIEKIMPYVNQYIQFRDGTIAKLPGFETAQEWFMAVVRPLMSKLGLFDIPNNVTDLPKYIQDMVKDGKAQLKEYEDGLKQLEAGKKQLKDAEKQLADGEKQLADGRAQLADGEKQVAQGEKDLAAGYADYDDGQAQLADGKKQLKEGRAQLKQYEDGMEQIAAGLDEVLSQKNYVRKDGTVVVASPADKLGTDYDYVKKTSKGTDRKMLSGESYVDLDKATEVRDVLADYVDDVTNNATKEIMSRVVVYFLLILASLLGLVAGIRGLLKQKGFKTGTAAAVLGLAALIGAIVTKFTDYVFLLEDGSANGALQNPALIIFALVAVCFAVVTFFTRDKTKKVKDEE